jgi:hypothetical protein
MKLLLVLFLILFCVGSEKVAVCVCGQLARWFPEYLVSAILSSNPSFQFYIFVNLQYHTAKHPFIYNSDSHITFHPTNTSSYKLGELLDYVTSLYHLPNSRLVSLTHVPPKTTEEWLEILNVTHLDRITQYKNKNEQASILNMYHHQELCMEQVLAYENYHSFQFSYVISTREDSYHFYPINLTSILLHRPCDMFTKDCLAWGGLSMRFQLFTRPAAITILGTRKRTYRELFHIGTVINVEKFELHQTKVRKVQVCRLPVEDIPVVAARHVTNGNICFIKGEVMENCIPGQYSDFVESHMCTRISTKLRKTNSTSVSTDIANNNGSRR